MSNWGTCNDGSGHNQCGDFPAPQNPDDGRCNIYPVHGTCEAPPLPVPACDKEYTTDYDPDNVLSPFKIFGQLFDQSCNQILDQNSLSITTPIT